MPALPPVGGDYNNWGTDLNTWLTSGHNADATHKFANTLHNIQVGAGNPDGPFTQVPPSVGLYGVISQGAAADPIFSNTQDSLVLNNPLPVGSGGIGLTSVAAGSILVGTGGGALRAQTQLNPSQGGTGVTSLTDHSIVLSHGSSNFSALTPSINLYPVTSQGPASDPTFSNTLDSLSLNTALPVSSGGIGLSSVASGSILVGNGGALKAISVSTSAYPFGSFGGSVTDPRYDIVPVAGGGTGQTTFTAGPLVNDGAGNVYSALNLYMLGPLVKGTKIYVRAAANSSNPSNNTTIYTVPKGKALLLSGTITGANLYAANATNVQAFINVQGVLYPLGTTTTVNTGTFTASIANAFGTVLLLEGESVVIKVPNNNITWAAFHGILFDPLLNPSIVRATIANIKVGNNTLYIPSPGKIGAPLVLLTVSSSSLQTGTIVVCNNSGSSVTLQPFIDINGGAGLDTTGPTGNAIEAAIACGTGTVTSLFSHLVPDGRYLGVNSNLANEVLLMAVMVEYPIAN